MDEKTLSAYDAQAREFAKRYENSSGGISEWFNVAFPKHCRVLDVGAGSGRDLALLLASGWEAFGVEPSGALIEEALQFHPELQVRLHQDGLPALSTIPDQSFDGILSSAVLMHIPEEELFDSIFSLRRILKPGGRLLISLPIEADGTPTCGRDSTGRIFNGLSAGKIEWLLSRCGFRKIGIGQSDDALGRTERRWVTLLFSLEGIGGSRSIDRIEAVLNRDKKTATYKLALFRAFAEIAMTHYNWARWLPNGKIALPLDLVAEKWLAYYWPLFESDRFIPQMKGENPQPGGKKILFRSSLAELARLSQPQGGLSAFLVARNGKALSPAHEAQMKKALKDIKTAIVNGPIVYAQGGPGERLFDYDGASRCILMGEDLWQEFSLRGPWIREATILRWSELTRDLARQEIGTGEILELLIRDSSPARNVQDSRALFGERGSLECVWTGDRLSRRGWEVDHAIPYSLWHNNDLWNLFPAASAANREKRDRLPTRRLLEHRRGTIQETWEAVSSRWPARFFHEAKVFGEALDARATSWPDRLFRLFCEAMEITALQRGVDRWDPEKKHCA